MMFVASGACAQTTAPTKAAPDLDVSGSITLATDYRSRGVSASQEKPVIQPQVTVAHKSGVYADLWASNLPYSPATGRMEVDVSAGVKRALGKKDTIDAGFIYYVFPDKPGHTPKADSIESYLRYSRVMGAVTAIAGFSYAPPQKATCHRNNFYLIGDVRYLVPKTKLTLRAMAGRTRGAWAPGAQFHNWLLGAIYDLKPAAVGLSYIDSDVAGRRGKGALVAHTRLSF